MRKTIAIVIILLMATVIVQAQTREDIINKHIKAAGGNKMGTINSIKRTAIVTTQGKKHSLVIYRKQPNYFRSETTIPGKGTIIEVFDGENAWTLNPMAGQTEPTLSSNLVKASLASQADMNGPIYGFKKNGFPGKYVGVEEIDGVKCHKITIYLLKWELPTELFFDIDSGLLLIMKSTITAPPEVAAEIGQGALMGTRTTLSDYREDESGMLVAHRIEFLALGITTTYEIAPNQYNISIDDAIFSMNK